MDAYDHLSDVDESKITWNVRVRVTRIWPSRTRNGVITRQNLLLLDSENTHMHASTTPEIWIRFQNLIHEGSLCIISNFIVNPADGTFRPVHHTRQITLLQVTIINVIALEDFSIPMHQFEIIPLEELHPAPQGDFSTDVIGVVEDLEPIRVLQTIRDGQVEFISFKISDGSLRHNVRIWGPLNPDAIALYDDQFQNPKIVILASTKISENKGNIDITNLASTKIYINLECPEVNEFKQGLINDGFMEFWPII